MIKVGTQVSFRHGPSTLTGEVIEVRAGPPARVVIKTSTAEFTRAESLVKEVPDALPVQ